jgi:hypothetical protein
VKFLKASRVSGSASARGVGGQRRNKRRSTEFEFGPKPCSWEATMLEQFIPLYCVLVGGAFAAGLAAIHMSQRLVAQSARARTLRRIQTKAAN